MSTRAERMADLRQMFAHRARAELWAAMALAAMGEIGWQDALDLYDEAMEAERDCTIAQLTAREPRQ